MGLRLKNIGIVKFKRALKRKSTDRVSTPRDDKAKMKTMINDLKSAVVNKFEMDKIKQLLVQTAKYRDRMMLNQRTDVKETFAVFYANPELVIMIFILTNVSVDSLISTTPWNRFYLTSNNGLMLWITMLLSTNGNPCALFWPTYSRISIIPLFTLNGVKKFMQFWFCYGYFHQKILVETLERLPRSIEQPKTFSCSNT